jgi:hypothetical protein
MLSNKCRLAVIVDTAGVSGYWPAPELQKNSITISDENIWSLKVSEDGML